MLIPAWMLAVVVFIVGWIYRVNTPVKAPCEKFIQDYNTVGELLFNIKFFDGILAEENHPPDFWENYKSLNARLTETVYREALNLPEDQAVAGSLLWLDRNTKIGKEATVVFEELKQFVISRHPTYKSGA